MVKLISALAAIILATSTLATAAPRQAAVSKTGKAAQTKKVKPAKTAKRSVAIARSQKKPAARKTTAGAKTTAIRTPLTAADTRPVNSAIVVPRTHDVRAEELEIKRLKSTVKAAEKAGDSRRAARERRAMYQLEADVRADKADQKDQQRAARNAKKKSRIPFWGWWR